VAIRPVFEDAAEALADVGDGASIMVGGFSAGLGAPDLLLRTLQDQTSAKDLTFIGNGTPTARSFDNDPEVPFFSFDHERVRKVICSFPMAASRRGMTSPYTAAFEEGRIELELVPQGTLAERLRAGGAGVPAFYTPTGVGTEFAAGKEVREFEGRNYVMERAIRADFAFIRALRADKLGNLFYRNTARAFSPVMAMAADCTIAEVEEIVEPGEISPDLIATPGIYVHRIVLRKPNGR